MPTVTVSNGETEEIYSGERGEVVFIRPNQDIRVAKEETFARDGRRIPADLPGEIELRQDGEEVWVYADGSDARS